MRKDAVCLIKQEGGGIMQNILDYIIDTGNLLRLTLHVLEDIQRRKITC